MDDDVDVREGSVAALRSLGCTVFEAASGHEALPLISQHPVDAVVTDVRMPNGTGLELLQRIREGNESVPVVCIMTGSGDIADSEFYDRGAEAVFHKPFGLAALESVLERLLVPPRVRWAETGNCVEPSGRVRMEVLNLESAIRSRFISLGHGGMFVKMPTALLSEGDFVSIEIGVAEGTLTRIDGMGIIRWTRSEEERGLSIGCGIEFIEFTDLCRSEVVQWIDGLKLKPFIPIS